MCTLNIISSGNQPVRKNEMAGRMEDGEGNICIIAYSHTDTENILNKFPIKWNDFYCVN